MGMFPNQEVVRKNIPFTSCLLLLFLSLSTIQSNCQSELRTSGSWLEFQTMPEEFGYNGVRHIFRDHFGYMWFGTNDGLIKFDGINSTHYEYSEDSRGGLKSNQVTSIVEDHNNILWIGTANGLCMYEREKDVFIHPEFFADSIRVLSDSYVSVLYIDSKQRLWSGVYGGGLLLLDTEKMSVQQFSYQENVSGSISSNSVTCILEDNKDNLWVGTQNGLNLFLEDEKKFRHISALENNKFSLSNNNITAMALDSTGNVWIGTRGGGLNKMVVFNESLSFKQYYSGPSDADLSNNNILSLEAGSPGFLWIGTENGGLNRLNIFTEEFEVYKARPADKYSLNNNSIWSLYMDSGARLWIGTATDGVNLLDGRFSKFESYQSSLYETTGLRDNDIRAFAENSKADIWVATDGGGIAKFNPQTKTFGQTIVSSGDDKSLANNAVQDIYCDENDNLWVGTWAGGVDLFDRNGNFLRNYKLETKEGRGDNNVIRICGDLKGNIYAGTAGSGLFKFDKDSNSFRSVVSEFNSSILGETSFVTHLIEDSTGSIWIATLFGLVLYKNLGDGNFETVDIQVNEKEGSISSNMIEFIYEDSQGRIWIGTVDHGLNLYNDEDQTFSSIQKSDGLPSNSMRGMVEDKLGILWISTNRGLVRFNYEKDSIKVFSSEDGLNSNELFERAIHISHKGEIYVGGEEGFNIFNPGQITYNTILPEVRFTGLIINNSRVEVGDANSPLTSAIDLAEEIQLNHKQSSFSVEFVAINYTRPGKNSFAYMLEGFDEDWIYSGNSRQAKYTNIPSGRYKLKVKAANNDGYWNEIPARLTIVISPPYWKTWWALLIYAFLIVSIISIALKIYLERLNIRHKLRLEKLEREKEHELNEANIEYFTNIGHEFRTPLSLIIAPLESILPKVPSALKEKLSIAFQNAQRLMRLTNDLLDFRKLEHGAAKLKVRKGDIEEFISEISSYFKVSAQRQNINYLFDCKTAGTEGYFDPDKLETITLNLLSNAFKFVGENGTVNCRLRIVQGPDISEKYDNIEIEVKEQSHFAEISVTDNGPGIREEDMPLIFEKFFRSQHTADNNQRGTGVGLALTKALVKLHHGHIFVSSVPQQETCFTVLLPLDEANYMPGEIEIVQKQEMPEILQYDAVRRTPPVEEECGKQNSKKEKDSAFSILIVEDNPELRKFLSKELASQYTVLVAENGKEGIELAMQEVPDLIVSDIVMPEMTGIELCQTIKADIRSSHIPVILLTAKTAIHEQIEGVETGADAYITKPFNLEFLLSKINQLIRTRQQLFARFSQEVYFLPGKVTDNELDQEFLQRAIDYIVANISDNSLNVVSLAKALNLSRSNVYRKIKALTGKSIIEFIRMIRLKQSIKLLETQKHSISEIAYLTGFTSPSYFTKSFREEYGKPPTDFLVGK